MTDAALSKSWTWRIAVVALREGIVVDETAPARNATGLVLSGQNATFQVNVNGDFEATLTGTPPLGDLLPGELELELAAAAGGPTRFEVRSASMR